MRANWISATSSTGGTGDLTLSGVSGWPDFSKVFGSSGTRVVEYEIIEFTDSSKLTPKQMESGIGKINLATGVLARDWVERTWDGTTYNPGPSGAAPSEINFGAVAANILVLCGPGVESVRPSFPGDFFGSQMDGVAASNGNTLVEWSPGLTASQYLAVWPLPEMPRQSRITQAALRVSTALTLSTTSSLYLGLYEWGGDHNKIADFGNIGDMKSVATLSGTLGTAIPWPGPCIVCVLPIWDNNGEQPKLASFYATKLGDHSWGSPGFIMCGKQGGSGSTQYSSLPAALPGGTWYGMGPSIPLVWFDGSG